MRPRNYTFLIIPNLFADMLSDLRVISTSLLLLIVEKGDIDFNLSEYIPENLMGFLEQDEGLKLDRLYCKLLMLEDTVEIYDLHAESGEINLMVRGSASQDGTIKIYAKIQFSSDFLADFPEEMTNMLKSEDNGWKSFQINVDNDPEKSSFMIENDLFKLVIGEKEADT